MTALALTDDQFIAAIREATRIRGEVEGCDWTIGVSRWDLAAYLAGHPEDIGGTPRDYLDMPAHSVRQKARRLIRCDLIDGCACGCRGDFVVRS